MFLFMRTICLNFQRERDNMEFNDQRAVCIEIEEESMNEFMKELDVKRDHKKYKELRPERNYLR